MRNAWVSKIVIVTLVGGLCLVGYGLAHAEKPIKPRFSVLSMDPAWVLDRTTSLQWQKTPATEDMAWSTASTHCTDLGGDARLPEVKELISLVDYSQTSPALPPGHPFTVGVQSRYWSAATFVRSPVLAWYVNVSDGQVETTNKTEAINRAWCVR